MKALFALVSLVSLISVSAHATEFLSQKEKKEILAAIDDACSDSWCESDYAFRYLAAVSSIEKKQVVIVYQSTTSEKKGWGARKICRIPNIEKFSDVVEGGGLTTVAFEALNSCF